MQISKKYLFGGALMAAGMVANAQTFNYQDTSSDGSYNSFASVQAYGGALSQAVAPAPLNTSSTGTTGLTGTTTVSTFQNPSAFGINGVWQGGGSLGYGYGGGLIQQFFTVSQNAVLRIDWDVTGTDAYIGSIVFEDVVAGAVLFELSPLDGIGGLSGSVDIPVSAGTEYGAILALQDIFATNFAPFYFNGQTQFITATLIPAPGAAGLLGLAGLAAVRRRRA